MKRIDTAGRDVTDLPGLWDESDTVMSTQIDLHKDTDGNPQIGPCFGFFLPTEFPLGNGWTQACPDRAELMACREQFDRVVAAYEVAIGHLFETLEKLDQAQKEIKRLKLNQPVEIKSTVQ